MAVILTDWRRGRRKGGSDRVMVVKKRQRKRSVQAVHGRGEKRRGAERGVVEGGETLPLYRGRGRGGGR
jgi:hypothetical protein